MSDGLRNPVRLKVRLRLEPLQRRDEVAAELFGKIDGNAGMDSALTVEEFRLVIQWHDRPVPNVRMEIESTIAVAPEADELIGRHIVPGQSERYHEAIAIERIEKLAAVRVIISAPD